jgi:hypothetical protein
VKIKIALKIETELLREARVLAAEEGTSMSALLATHLEHIVRERKGYQQARGRALARLRRGFDLRWALQNPGMNYMNDKFSSRANSGLRFDPH